MDNTMDNTITHNITCLSENLHGPSLIDIINNFDETLQNIKQNPDEYIKKKKLIKLQHRIYYNATGVQGHMIYQDLIGIANSLMSTLQHEIDTLHHIEYDDDSDDDSD